MMQISAAHGFAHDDRGNLLLGGFPAASLAKEFGTPLLVLDEDRFRENCRAYREAFARFYPKYEVIYASKALCVLATCQLAHEEGLAIDVASGGELFTALRAGVPAQRIFFHGNNKTPEELRYALSQSVGRIIVDNFTELSLLAELAKETGKTAHILLRITPGIEPRTHRAIQTGGVDSKFGFDLNNGSALEATQKTLDSPHLALHGFHCHIGSQILELEPFEQAAEVMMDFLARINREVGFLAEELNLGGGLGIRYLHTDEPPSIASYIQVLAQRVKAKAHQHGLPLPILMVEPGRSIVGPAGVTLYTVGTIKRIPGVRTYASVDGGMYENPRPALYAARYEAVVADRLFETPTEEYAIAGRCCESGDVLIWEASLPPLNPGNLVAVFATGAYTYSMASNYNRFPRPAVVLVGRGRARLIVERETYEDLVRKDIPLPKE
ncbi:MAG: diaminopimelate decarboxylase [Armatimonadota bacterium]|nr:diaminopimelate decarboxylase [Armatimonadota bacterium]